MKSINFYKLNSISNFIYLHNGNDVSPNRDPQICKVKINICIYKTINNLLNNAKKSISLK